MLAETPKVARYADNIYTGFRWLIERADHEPFADPALVAAIHAALSSTGSRLAGEATRRPLASWLLNSADQVARNGRIICELEALTLMSASLGWASGRVGSELLQSWPLLQQALAAQGVIGEGPLPSEQPMGAKGKRPVLCCRLFFDPTDVGLTTPVTWTEPPATATEIGGRDRAGVTLAGIDYLRSDRATVVGWVSSVADLAAARNLGGRAPFGIASSGNPLPADVAARARTAVREAAEGIVSADEAARIAADCRPVVAHGKFLLLRSGATTAEILDIEAYASFVRLFAAALTRRGLEARYLEEDDPLAMTEQLRLKGQTVFVSEDYELVSQVELRRRLDRQAAADRAPKPAAVPAGQSIRVFRYPWAHTSRPAWHRAGWSRTARR
jgi:hypothetical protein